MYNVCKLYLLLYTACLYSIQCIYYCMGVCTMYLLYVRVHCIHNTIYVRLMYIIVYNAYNVYSVPLSAVKLMFMYRQSPKLKTVYRYENQF